jgi:predicted RNA binding protein YcfA (HicA-like mRNA interferase family)
MDEKAKWTNLTNANIVDFLTKKGFKVSRNIVKILLKKHGYVKRKALKRHLRCNAFQIHWRKKGSHFVSKYFFGRLTITAFADFRRLISEKIIGACFWAIEPPGRFHRPVLGNVSV